MGRHIRVRAVLAHIIRRDDDLHIVDASLCDQHEELFYGRITYGKTADGLGLSVDIDVTAEVRPLLVMRLLQVITVGIVDLHRKMETASRIKVDDAVNSFRDLAVSLSLLWALAPAGSEDIIGTDIYPFPVAFCPDLEFSLFFQHDERERRRRVRHPGLFEERPYARFRLRADLRYHVRNRTINALGPVVSMSGGAAVTVAGGKKRV